MDSFFEIGIAFGGGHRPEDVGHRHLERYVHTALEVKSETHTELFYFIESVAEPYLLVAYGVDVVLIGIAVGVRTGGLRSRFLGIFLSLVLIMVAHNRKREVEEANKHQEEGYDTGHNTS